MEQHVKNKQFDVANRRFSVLRTFEPGQTVIVRDYRPSTKPNWVPGTISEKTGPVSYRVQVEQGATWRRHLDQIKNSSLSPKGGSVSEIPETDRNTVAATPQPPVEPVIPLSTEIRQSVPDVRPSSDVTTYGNQANLSAEIQDVMFADLLVTRTLCNFTCIQVFTWLHCACGHNNPTCFHLDHLGLVFILFDKMFMF